MANLPIAGLPLPRRFFVETWGCQMNELDSQRLTGQLMQEGVLPTRNPREADLILLNSCSVREKAAQKAFSRLGEYRLLKKKRPHLLIGFCGCVAQQVGEQALRQMPPATANRCSFPGQRRAALPVLSGVRCHPVDR